MVALAILDDVRLDLSCLIYAIINASHSSEVFAQIHRVDDFEIILDRRLMQVLSRRLLQKQLCDKYCSMHRAESREL